jgi:hypothetical protein
MRSPYGVLVSLAAPGWQDIHGVTLPCIVAITIPLTKIFEGFGASMVWEGSPINYYFVDQVKIARCVVDSF